MKQAAIAGFAAGAAMMIGGALGAVAPGSDKPVVDASAEILNPMIGGQAMLPDHDIMDNMAASPLHSQLVAAMKDSGVAAALKSHGEFTVFAPTNAAFGTTAQNKPGLARRMSYLIVPGKYDSVSLLRVINEGGGQARLRTAEGGVLVARMNGPTNIVLLDEQGNTANIAIYDVRGKNGIIQVIDRMLEPAGSPRQIASR
jgi:uncharacterized surface protein with fasciclin (FAS1) repeats